MAQGERFRLGILYRREPSESPAAMAPVIGARTLLTDVMHQYDEAGEDLVPGE